MPLPALLAVRAALGGLFVVLFALVGEVVAPKRFAGVFGASPSIALANLALVAGFEGAAKAASESRAMIGGAVALLVACSVGLGVLRRLHALAGSAVMLGTWLVVAAIAAGALY